MQPEMVSRADGSRVPAYPAAIILIAPASAPGTH